MSIINHAPEVAINVCRDVSLDGMSHALLSPCRAYRYTLRRAWGGGPRLLFVMLNPSTADALADDPTIRKCMRIARLNCCDGIDVVNLFAYRATDPRMLAMAQDPVGPDNDYWIGMAALRRNTRAVIAAWGANAAARIRGEYVRDNLLRGIPLLCLGCTKDGSPRHPLFVRDNKPLEVYEWKT